ncbi:MAG: Na+/H+ antiporter NhaC family protein [Methylohalobius crimeensis]
MSTWLSLLPALIAIPVAFLTHRVLLALGAYVFIGALILEQGWLPDASGRFLKIIWQVVTDRDSVMIIVFSLMIGGLIGLIQKAGGIEGFVRWAEERRLIGTPRRVAVLAFATSLALFVETNFGVLVAGLIALPLFDRYRLSRLRLSYLLDTTCAPKCMVLPLNAWGAYVISLLADQGVEQPVGLLMQSVGFIFYGWIALLLAGIVAAFGWEIPWRLPLSDRVIGELPHFGEVITPHAEAPGCARHLWGPIGLLIVSVLLLLAITGDAPLAIFLAVTLVLVGTGVYFRHEQILSWKEMLLPVWQGTRIIMPLMYLLIFAFSVGVTTQALGTGFFLASSLHGQLDPVWLPFLVFGIGCLISFSTGSSWGTFAILIPIVVPLADVFQVSPALLLGAALSGGLFGDHCSPVSDTTMIASLAGGVKPVEHIRHQFPYAVLGGLSALALYGVAGALML